MGCSLTTQSGRGTERDGVPVNTLTHSLMMLPKELINTIISYTLSPQPPELLNDVRSCVKTTNVIYDYYNKMYPISREDAKEWISNDIYRFLNNDIPTIHGLQELYLSVFRRWYMNTSKDLDTMRTYITRIDVDMFPNDIKVSIGLLTPYERDELIVFLGISTPHDIE